MDIVEQEVHGRRERNLVFCITLVLVDRAIASTIEERWLGDGSKGVNTTRRKLWEEVRKAGNPE